MNEFAAALYTRLSTDATLVSLGSLQNADGTFRIFEDIGPQGTSAVYPIVVYNQQAGADEDTHQGRAATDLVYQVKAITKSNSAVLAGNMAKRIDTLLAFYPIQVTGYAAFYLHRETPVSYSDEENGILYRHRGGLYRVMLSPR